MLILKSILTKMGNKSNKWYACINRRLCETSAMEICEKLLQKSITKPISTDLLNGKVAIIVGGTGSIGLACAKEMLKYSLEGVTIADLDMCKGEMAVEELCKEYGKKKAIFVKCDATNPTLFDWTFKTTLKTYKHVDILINCVGTFNEKNWEREICVNLYMSKSCKGRGGTIVNVSSIMGLEPYSGCPVFTATQYGIIGLTSALGCGEYYENTWVKFMTLCPGFTKSDLFKEAIHKCIHNKFSEEFIKESEIRYFQDPQYVGRGLIRMLLHSKHGSIWVVEDDNEAVEYKIPNFDKLIKKC